MVLREENEKVPEVGWGLSFPGNCVYPSATLLQGGSERLANLPEVRQPRRNQIGLNSRPDRVGRDKAPIVSIIYSLDCFGDAALGAGFSF